MMNKPTGKIPDAFLNIQNNISKLENLSELMYRVGNEKLGKEIEDICYAIYCSHKIIEVEYNDLIEIIKDC